MTACLRECRKFWSKINQEIKTLRSGFGYWLGLRLKPKRVGKLARMGNINRGGSIRYWALIVSLALHTGALAVFTGVKLSGGSYKAPTGKPSLTLRAIERVAERPKPMPRVVPIVPPAPENPKTQEPPLVASTVEEPIAAPLPLPEHTQTAEAVGTMPVEPSRPHDEVEFFGQKSIVEQVCYVVDCSGSMYGRMYLVKDQLKQSILNLNSDQAFCIVFFMEGRQVMMSGAGRLELATAAAKSQALKLIASIRPGGRTDAAHALEMAMRLKGADGRGPEVLYFLTDGFDLDASGSQNFMQSVERLRQTLVPKAVMHTIAFSPPSQDRRMLRTLAENTGGGFVEVN
jgi:hypothetical protein